MATAAFINEESSRFEPGDGRPFLVHDPDTVWIVESGKVDLFLIPLEAGKPEGARSHVIRVGAGNAVLGMPHTGSSDLGLRAIPTADARIVTTSVARMIEIAGTPERAGAIRMIENWVATLSEAIASVPPRDFLLLAPGSKVTTAKEPRKAVPDENSVVWVRQTEGSSRFPGTEAMAPITPGLALPICSPVWLEMDARSAVEVFDTASFLQQGGPAALTLFHEYAMRLMVQRYLDEEKKETVRLQTKADVFAGALDNAFHVLAAPLSEREAELPGIADGDVLLAACQALGKGLHIEFRQHPDSRRGIPQKDPIANIARASSVRVRRVVLDGNWWRSNAGPLLAVIDADKTPVALLQPAPGTYELYDPRTRTRTRVNAKLAATLGAYAWVFYRPFEPRAITAWDLARFGVAGAESDVRSIVLMGIATGLLAMVTPIFTGFVFDTTIPGAQRTQLVQMMLILIACAIGTGLFSLTRNFALLRLEGQMDAHIQSAVWDRLLSLPVPFFREYSAGDLAMRSLGINAIRQILTGSTLSSILAGVFSIFSFLLLFYYSWKMALLASGLILIAVIFTATCGYAQIRYQRDLSRVRGHLSGLVLQFISGISKFRISGTENRAFASWSGEFSRQKEFSFKARRITNYVTTFNAVFPVVSSMAIFYMMAWMLSKSDTALSTTGQFLAFNAAFGQFLASALGLSASLVSILAIVPHYERASPILKTLPEVNEAKSDPGELTGSIEASHIAFRYRADAPLVLRDVSFTIRPGEFVAFVGPSGSGKSTLFRMLLGFEKPGSGAIFYDGQELSGLDIQAVRRQMGVVLQNGKLLSGDIFTNIVGSAPLTMEDAWEAARLSGFEQDVKQMPMGMHTVVSEGGGGLSGGQRQRLLIARAIVGKPRILLFDEATSALDNQTQAIVSRSLESLKSTRIVIAHRLSTVINADRIFVIDNGVVAQVGKYEELIGQEGLFAELAKRQLE